MSTARPKRLSDVQKRVVAEKIADELISNSDFTGDDREGIIDDLVKYGESHSDGYEFAKALDDRCGWSVDSGIVDILDGWSSVYSSELNRVEAEWFAANPFEPPFAIGAKVSFGRSETGVIDGIYEHGPAKYLVKVDGDPKAVTNNSRRILNFEDVNALTTPSEAA